MTFFEILDPRPEAKTQVRTSHVQKLRSLMRVRVRRIARETDTHVIAPMDDAVVRDIDLDHWCAPATFSRLMGALFRWVADPGELEVKVNLSLGGDILAPRPLVPVVRDSLADLDDAAPLAAIEALAVPDAMVPPLPRNFTLDHGGALTCVQTNIVHDLLDGKYYEHDAAFASLFDIPDGFDDAAVTDLANHGVVVRSVDEFGDWTLALKLENLSVRGTSKLHRAELVANIADSTGRKFEKFAKLELVPADAYPLKLQSLVLFEMKCKMQYK